MKFHIAWDSLEKENRNLKLLVIVLCLIAISLTVTVMNTAAQPPFVVERGCITKALTTNVAFPTDDEMKSFIQKAIAARFNSDGESQEPLSLKQRGFREREQVELAKQNMKQTVLVNDVKITKENILVDADRVLSVANVRSALRFPLKVQVESTHRTESNPYGLVLTEVDTVTEEAK